jgi:isochorismate synthase
MTDIFSNIQSALASKFPFAVYSKPQSNAVTGLFQNDAVARKLTDFTQEGFVFAPFDGSKRCFIPADAATILSDAVKADGFAPAGAESASINPEARSNFESLVEKSVSEIKSGRFEKLVLSRKEAATLSNDTITDVFQKLLYAYPAAFRYCFYHPDSGLWMGATPEQLLKVEDNILHTVARAGTQLYNEDAPAVWEEKEKQEQLFVTEYILGSLQPFVDAIQSTKPYTFRAGTIVHIKTDITAVLKEEGMLEKIINALHPTPAVCGLPRQEAKKFLLENEGYDREYYSGFLGEINRDFATNQSGTDLFVNLRCMKIEDNTAQLFIGCGITKDSNPQKEFLETVNKSMTMRKVI